MAQVIRYGRDGAIELDLSPEHLVADWSGPYGEPIDDPAAAVAAALTDPLEFPPLAQATAPGDRIAIAVGESVPQADAVVAGIVHELTQGFAEAKDISIVHPPGMKPPVARLSEADRDAISIVVHCPDDREKLAYLAASREGEPIYVNRTLVDADIVVPVGAFRAPQTLAYYGVHGGLFPAFADLETQQRFRAYRNNASEAQRNQRRSEAEEAAWVLGILFTVQVIPGERDEILNVLAGHSAAVEQEGEELVAGAWGFETRRLAQLVVASIEGGEDEQTWHNIGRALHAARQVAEDDAAIVLCTEVAERPGVALQQLQASLAHGPETADELDASSEPDGICAAVLAQLQETATVFLLSNLTEEQVEELGMAYVADGAAVQRLASQFESCILLGGAQRTAPVAALD